MGFSDQASPTHISHTSKIAIVDKKGTVVSVHEIAAAPLADVTTRVVEAVSRLAVE